MMLRIGSKKGFTLIEVMVTVAVLSFGIVMLYQSFFISIDAVGYAANRLTAKLWIESKIAEEKDSLMRLEEVVQGEEDGTAKFNNKDFSWHKSVQLMDIGLYSLTLTLLWKESGRERKLLYSTYLIS